MSEPAIIHDGNGRITMDDALATIHADQETRIKAFGEELQALQKRLGVRLEIHQIIVPVIDQDRR
jgi:hypothetical protein